ncbi:hypothetical protein M1563_00725 [Patescibacteria group bacterium]|nr:hypothetical protein [Patescibacteria group bacterium]
MIFQIQINTIAPTCLTNMHKSLTILVVILLIILMIGYLIWLKGKFQTPQNAISITPTPYQETSEPTPMVSVTITATPSATPTPNKTASAAADKTTK